MRKVVIILILIMLNYSYASNTVTREIIPSKLKRDQRINEIEQLKMINTLIDKVQKARKNGVEEKVITRLLELFKEGKIDVQSSNEILYKILEDKRKGKSITDLINQLNNWVKEGIKGSKLKRYIKKEFQRMDEGLKKSIKEVKNRSNNGKERISIHQLQLEEHKKMEVKQKKAKEKDENRKIK